MHPSTVISTAITDSLESLNKSIVFEVVQFSLQAKSVLAKLLQQNQSNLRNLMEGNREKKKEEKGSTGMEDSKTKNQKGKEGGEEEAEK